MTASSFQEKEQQLAAGKRRRKIQEAFTGYLFVFPALLATLLFGLWPVIAGFYESLKAGSPITNRYVGLNNYVRSLGSLTYILLFTLCLAFLWIGYAAWRSAILYQHEHGGNRWLYIVPGILAGLGFIVLAFIFVTGLDGYGWAPIALLLVALAGFVVVDQVQLPRDKWNWRVVGKTEFILLVFGAIWIIGPRLLPDGYGWLVLPVLVVVAYIGLPELVRIKTGAYISNITLMGTTMLLAILLARYTIDQMQGDTEEAQDITRLIFNEEVLDATVMIPDDTTLIDGLTFEEDIIVEVNIDGETIEAPLAPEIYEQFPADRITRLETALANNQKIQVVLPDGTIAEGELTGLPMGEKLTVGLLAEDPQAIREADIYSALNVGEGVIMAEGHTESLRKQIYAALGFFLGLATIFTMTWVRRQLDDEENPALYRWLHRGRVLMGIAVLLIFFYMIGAVQLNRQAAAGMRALSEEQFDRAYEFATGEAPRPVLRPENLAAELMYWPQVLLVSLGALLIGAAYLVWQSAQRRETPLGFVMTIVLALLMMVGGWLLISELPRSIGMAGREAEDTFDAIIRTAMYSAGTVPVQLALGLFLAYFLFSEISWGKSLFRVVYFMPYIAPSVATSTVFIVIFSLNNQSLANRALGLVGIEPLAWLKEPDGVVRIFYEQILGGDPLNIPGALAGPSLALFTVILYNIWVFAGYNAVVFLAGLGAIPFELYEAAEVDGAGRWSRFRNITLPLLSPTTFFLSMLSIIGTFKAFSHIYVLRNRATGKEIDTMSVHIFQTLYSANDPGYAAALAFMLFGMILVLTLVQNRLAREQVFYG